MPRRLPRAAAALALGAFVLLAAGCSGSKTYPVTGKVTVNGKPAGGAIVVFHPAGNLQTMDRKPTAMTKDDGTFVVGTLRDDDGGAAGEYVVTVIWPGKAKAAAAKGLGGEDERGGDAPDQLKGKYQHTGTSGLKATIKAEKNEFPPFELTN